MSPLAQSDGHDAPRLIREAVPCEAAMVEDVFYLGKVQRHAFGVAARQHQRCAFALSRTDGALDTGRRGTLVLGRRRPCPAPGPAAGDAILLADPGLVLPPQFYGRAARERRTDRCHLGGEVFFNAGMASASCAWWRGRADSLRYPMARSSWLSVCLLINTANSSRTHCTR